MRKHIKLMLVFYWIMAGLHAQNPATTGAVTDSITNKSWYKKINQSFGLAATGQSDAANEVNYGSFEPLNGSFKFNFFSHLGSLEKRQIPFINVSVGGKIVGDNMAVLFNNSRFNTDFNLKLKLHFPILKKLLNNIHVSQNEIDSINIKIAALENRKLKESADVARNLDLNYLTNINRVDHAKLVKINDTINIYTIAITDLINEINCIPAADNIWIPKLSELMQSLYQKRQKLFDDQFIDSEKIAKTNLLINDNNTRLNNIASQVYNIDSATSSKRLVLETSFTIRGSTFLWLSVVGSLERKKYYTFKDDPIFSQQYTDHKYTTHEVGLELNFIGFSGNAIAVKPRVHVANLGITHIRDNNIADLSTTELTDSRKFSSNDSTHSLSTKYNVYLDPIVEYDAWKLYLNYYYYLGKKRNMAFHIFPDVQFRDTKQNPFNVGLGFIFSIKNKKDNSVVNVELYGKLVDAGKALPDTKTRLFDRNEFGLHFGVPINF